MNRIHRVNLCPINVCSLMRLVRVLVAALAASALCPQAWAQHAGGRLDPAERERLRHELRAPSQADRAAYWRARRWPGYGPNPGYAGAVTGPVRPLYLAPTLAPVMPIAPVGVPLRDGAGFAPGQQPSYSPAPQSYAPAPQSYDPPPALSSHEPGPQLVQIPGALPGHAAGFPIGAAPPGAPPGLGPAPLPGYPPQVAPPGVGPAPLPGYPPQVAPPGLGPAPLPGYPPQVAPPGLAPAIVAPPAAGVYPPRLSPEERHQLRLMLRERRNAARAERPVLPDEPPGYRHR